MHEMDECIIRDLGEEELLELADLFKMFADSTRIKILYDLFEGEKNVTTIFVLSSAFLSLSISGLACSNSPTDAA